MSSIDNNQENGLPTPDENRKTSVDFLPRFFKTEANRKFLQSTLDQLIQPGVAEKLNGYVGRRTAKAFSSLDNYVSDVSDQRENYQLEPATVIKDQLDNVTFYKDYNDYINQIAAFGGKTDNHTLLNSQESYSWNPNIDWDKIVNFRNYYWLPNGPDAITVRGQSRDVVSTYSVTLTGDEEATAYLFSPDGLTSNPRITLYRGQTYRFDINTPGHPMAFAISRTVVPGTALLVAGREGIRGSGLYDSELYDTDQYDLGDFIVIPDPGSVTFEADENVSTLYNDGIRKINTDGNEVAVVFIEKGTIEFTIPFNAPDRLFYISKYNINVSGIFSVANIEDNSFLDADADIVGKKTYKSANGVELSNGMKVRFGGDVEPRKYTIGEWFVEGVGDKIKLINSLDLIIPAQYSENLLVPFDSEPFDNLPFSDGSGFARNKDYIVINRASNDRNAWTRYNRWFHREVIETSASLNNSVYTLNEESRAKRPIIEFEPGLRLYDFGTFAKQDVDLIDTFTTDVFSTIEGTIGYNIDQIDLAEGMRILFTADTDRLVRGKIFTVNFLEIDGERQISLIETPDTDPLELETVLIKQGAKNSGQTYYFSEGEWRLGQEKTKLNQPPLFDLCCPSGREFADLSIFDSTGFQGTKIFSYRQGQGAADIELGFPLTYRSINNTGDIVFDFNLVNDVFTVQNGDEQQLIKTDTAYLRRYTDRENFVWTNGYSNSPSIAQQSVIKQYIADENQNQVFEIDMFDNAALITDIKISVFVNKVFTKDYSVNRINNRLFLNFESELNNDDIVEIKTKTTQPKNSNGFYEFPYNLERNPLNEEITEFTLGEIFDHVNSMIENIPNIENTNNLRDLGDLDSFGTRFVKHSGPVNLASYHITNKNYNIVKALNFSRREYGKFKRNFISIATDLGFDGPVKQHVDRVFNELNKDRVKTEPFYFSDMLAVGPSKIIEYTVIDPRNPFYALNEKFTLTELSSRSVLVYLNNRQLTKDLDYNFNDDGFLLLTAGQQQDDKLEIFEFETTDGSYVPPTPTKLGLFPRYVPQLLIDDTYLTKSPIESGPYKIYGQLVSGERGWFYPVYTTVESARVNDENNQSRELKFLGLSESLYQPATTPLISQQDSFDFTEYPRGIAVIRGHDGSTIRAFKDFRDNLLLELELRIFNNIKIDYDTGFLKIDDFVGGYFRNTGFNTAQINNAVLPNFIDWLKLVDQDYTLNDFYDRDNRFTFNYSSMNGVNGETLPGFWRGIYFQAFDTDHPHTAPWEMLGFSIKPAWWDQTYGAAPYTSNNLILWEDLEAGIVREPNKAIRVLTKYARPGLTDFIPVDAQGRLKDPISTEFAKNFFFRFTTQNFKFGDHSPVETAWRRSSEYPFALLLSYLLNNPTRVMGLGFDVSRIERNFANQLVYKETGKPIELDKLIFPNTVSANSRTQTSGIVNYIYNLVASNILTVYDNYKTDVVSIKNNLGFKIAGFTEKSKFKFLLDSRSPSQSTEGGAFVPEENYQIFLNTSSAIDVVTYSAVLVEKTPGGFIVRGYDQSQPFFRYFEPIDQASDITVTVGGVSESTTRWNADRPYAQGQVLENNNNFFRVTRNFRSGSEFNLENLAPLAELPIVGGKRAQFKRKFDNRKTLTIPYGTRFDTSQEVVDFILGYESYLKSKGFDFNYFNPETESVENWNFSAREFLFWTTQGWTNGTTIALSPSAANIVFRSKFSVVDDLYDGFYDYTILKSNGRLLETEFNNVYRENNEFGLSPTNTDDGIYNIKLPLVQKEHVVLFDNKTVFNDLIYQPSTGYRQERLKVLGYRTDEWNGSLNVPGFVFDEVNLTLWEQWKDYRIGDLVKYKQYYYVATENVPGLEFFDYNFWYKLNQKPESKLMTNFDYRINQFTDFYDLDSDNFDSEQQRLAQHLIGYQKRKYLSNIINDDVSQYKFYQGFIREKGTRNVITKLFDALNSADRESLDFYEDWAIQVGQYGAVDKFEQIEVQIDEEKIKESPQAFELVESIPQDIFDEVYRISPFELFDKPADYHSNPFPVINQVEEFLPTDGYVDINTVEYKVRDKLELANADVNQINSNDYIWLLDDDRNNWTILQYFETFARATSLNEQEEFDRVGLPLWTFEIDRWAAGLVTPGELIGVKSAQVYGVFGFYEVDAVDFNRITVKVNPNNVFLAFEDENFVITKLRSVRVNDLEELNVKVQEKLLDKQKIWVDQYDDNWAVIENTSVFNLTQEIKNPSEFDSSNQEFSSVIAATSDNRNLFVAAPGDENGKVFYYRRTNENNEFKKDQVITADQGLFDIENSRFGESIAVSPDGDFLAIGAPSATQVKTRFKGMFDPDTEYNKNDIVAFRESLWKANRRILSQVAQQPFNTFSNYLRLDNASDGDLRLLFVGDPGLKNQQTDHILVRAPVDQYLGSKPGDRVFLNWITSSYVFPTLDPTFPFGNQIPEITPDFLRQQSGHEIVEKIDNILFVRTFISIPEIGQTVTTDTGSGEVFRVRTLQDSLIIYVKNTNGVFDITDQLFIADDQEIGEYTQENTGLATDQLGGLWFIETKLNNVPFSYNNKTEIFDVGKGLVYQDLIPGETARSVLSYFNIQTTVFETGPIVNENLRASFISQLTYFGNPGGVSETTQLDNRWIFRAPRTVSNNLSIGEEFNFEILQDNIDLTGTGFTFAQLNKSHVVYDIWDGFIDFEFTRFDFSGFPFELAVGDIIEDVQTPFDEFGGLAQTSTTTSRAKVVYYKRQFNSVRIFVNIISGNWQQLNNIARYEIRRLGNVVDLDTGVTIRPGEPNRVIGTIFDVSNSIVLGTELIGGFVVVEENTAFSLASTAAEILNSEYFIFNETTEIGISRLPNTPFSLNKDYVQVYNIPADSFGEVDNSLINEGVVLIYRRLRNGQYRFVRTLVSEYRLPNKRFGARLQFAKDKELYKLYIASDGELNQDGSGNRTNPGSIEIYNHGANIAEQLKSSWSFLVDYEKDDVVIFRGNYYTALKSAVNQTESSIFDNTIWNNISWRIAKDENYRGEFDNSYPYRQGAIVFKNESTGARLYRAITNIAIGTEFSITDWQLVDQKIDYLGYLPNLTGLALFNQSVWDPLQGIDQFSSSFDVTESGSVLVVTSKQIASNDDNDPYTTSGYVENAYVSNIRPVKSVLVYRQIDNKYLLSQVIPSPDNTNGFADQVRISTDGEFIAISEPANDNIKIDQGKVYIYQQINGEYILIQKLVSPNNEISEQFGYSISFGKDNLVVASLNGDMVIPTIFDNSQTTFDRGFTDFSNVRVDSGVVYVYENLKDKFVYTEQFRYKNVQNRFGQVLLNKDNHIYTGMPLQGDETAKGMIVDFRKPKAKRSWNTIQEYRAPVDINKIKSVFLYNKKQNIKITDLDYIDPVQGKIASVADQEIDYKTDFDPALYTSGIISNLVNSDLAWGSEHVGTVWWKIDSVKFAYPYFGNIQYQKTNWNLIPSGNQIQVAEWVRSSIIPSEWDRTAAQQPDNERGISGQTLYGDDFFSQKFIYDEQSKTFKSEYYFWVRNKITVPGKENRNISVLDIRRLIEDPRSQGYRFVNLLNSNSFVVNNCESLLTNSDVILVIQYNNSVSQQQNRHIEYQIVSDGLETSLPHLDIEQKWFDSLIGFDIQGRSVPDTASSPKQKYGVQSEPRQSMFVNQQEALKQFIERTNLVLKDNIIVDESDISNLDNSEMLPAIQSGRYDIKINIEEELRFISTTRLEQAQLIPIIVNGRLVRVDIGNPGRGYRVAPSYEILGTGKNAEIQLEINSLGEIVSAKVIARGSGYSNETAIEVRRFSVLVENDQSSRGRWSIYMWNPSSREWNRTAVQAFDVTAFWNYLDWYAVGYNEFTTVDFRIEQTYELSLINDAVGNIVKINNVGSGGWLLLEKIADQQTEEFSVNYKTIGKQNGTIQFSSSLYDFKSNSIGYDNRSYDSMLYDNVPITELRIILDTIKNKLFVGKLAIEYNQLFFASIRYVLSEQLYVDWVFKTAFVKIKHNLGTLDQPVNFKSDTLSDYKEFVNEVKPYTTNVREYIDAYESFDNTNSVTTDFDLQPVYNDFTKQIEVSNAVVSQQQLAKIDDNTIRSPRKSWLENFAYRIKEIQIGDPGSGYTLKPNVRIEGGGGSGAKAEAFLGYGKITNITITDAGSGYVSTPQVIIEGSQAEDGLPARATAVLGNGVVRTTNMSIKFDRIFGKYYFSELSTVETFTGTNITDTFDLEWPADLNKKTFNVFINNRQLLRSEFVIENIDNFDKSYQRKIARVRFTKTPSLDTIITVEYKKSVALLSAEDRIQFEYNPKTGMLGQDLGQLMDGVDYGGVEIKSFDFAEPDGWDIAAWDNDDWDTADDRFEDQVFRFDGSTTAIILTKPLENNMVYNVYLKRNSEDVAVRIDDPDFNTAEQTNASAIMLSLTGDGETDVIDISNLDISVRDGDQLIIRKITSDGSFIPDSRSYDVALSGGNLNYQSARGVNAEEIVVDGDGFVTATTSKGPEELIPGQLLDTLDIKVFTRTTSGQGIVYSQNYKINGNVYELGVVPNSADAVFVKVDGVILTDQQYTIDWENNTVTIDQSVGGVDLSITAFAQSAQNIVDFGSFDLTTSVESYNTNIKFNADYDVVVIKQGIRINTSVSKDESTGNLLIGFANNLDHDTDSDTVNYIIFEGDALSNYSQITKDKFETNGTIGEFTLSSAPFFAEPTAYNTVVKLDNQILAAGYNIKYTVPVARPRRYKLESFQQPGGALQAQEVKVFINGEEIFTPVQWRFDVVDSEIVLSDEVGFVDDLIEIYVVTDGDYQLSGKVLTLNNIPQTGQTLEVFKFSNHDLLKIERINYDVVAREIVEPGDIDYVTYQRLTYGEIKLRSPAVGAEYVWVTKNRTLLTPNSDYFLTDDKTKIQLVTKPSQEDIIEVTHFAAPVIIPRFAYRQFKDMLNRTHFKRLDAADTVLAQDLNYYDLRIEVVDGGNLAMPNKSNNLPGIVFIDGERIEYFVKEHNTLRQLRRGTLGTGVKSTHSTGTKVYNQSSVKNIPYKDRTLTQSIVANGVDNEFMFSFDVANQNEIEVFVGGKRLNKTETVKFNPQLAQDSPKGDETFSSEFELGREIALDNDLISGTFAIGDTVFGTNNFVGKILAVKIKTTETILRYQNVEGEALPSTGIRTFNSNDEEIATAVIKDMPTPTSVIFKDTPNLNQKIVVIKKIGKVWTKLGVTLGNAENDIAEFLKSGTGELPE